jgi:ATP-dependent RNA helicase DDX46/PRP5
VSAAEATGVVTGANAAPGSDTNSMPGSGAATPMSSSASDKLELAKKLASKINLKSNAAALLQQSTESYLAGKPGQQVITAKTVADHLAAQLNAKLNYQPQNDPAAEAAASSGDAFEKFEEELIINDFPQQARWRVTSKEALAQISEYSDAGITVRGTYFPPNKPIPDGERKLFLAIESTNELAVQKAKVEITRLLKEELLRLQTSGFHHMSSQKPGRYKVL